MANVVYAVVLKEEFDSTYEGGPMYNYDMTLYSTKEKAYNAFYDYCIQTYDSTLANSRKYEATLKDKKKVGRWERKNPRDEFDNILYDIKSKFFDDNYQPADKMVVNDNEWGNNKNVFEKYLFDGDSVLIFGIEIQ